MKLLDLDPRWLLDKTGRRVGFIFISPQQMARHDGTTNPTPWRQTCFVEGRSFKEQCPIVWQAMADLVDEDHEFGFWQPCNPSHNWKIAGDIENATFETMTVTPSLDGSAGGLWHGHITNGQIA